MRFVVFRNMNGELHILGTEEECPRCHAYHPKTFSQGEALAVAAQVGGTFMEVNVFQLYIERRMELIEAAMSN